MINIEQLKVGDNFEDTELLKSGVKILYEVITNTPKGTVLKAYYKGIAMGAINVNNNNNNKVTWRD